MVSLASAALVQSSDQLVNDVIIPHCVAAKRIAMLHVIITIVGTSICQERFSWYGRA